MRIPLIALSLTYAAMSAFGQAPNVVNARVDHLIQFGTQADQIQNTPVLSQQRWAAELRNIPDASGASVFSPRIEMVSGLPFVRFGPVDPVITPAGSGLTRYTWDFPGLEVKEPLILPVTAQDTVDPVPVKPRVSITRTVTPTLLTQAATTQTVTVNMTIEEALPPEINGINVGIGIARFVFGGFTLVQSEIISFSTVTGWSAFSDGAEVGWHANPSSLQIGQTYTFVATINSVKSPQLLGSPVFKPSAAVRYLRTTSDPPVTSSSVVVAAPDNSLTATFTVSGLVQWNRSSGVPRYDFALHPAVSQVTAPPPPFRVIVPATVRVEPETINLKSTGMVTAFLKLESPYELADVDVGTVRCNGAPVDSAHQSNEALILKFRTSDLQLVPGDSVQITVAGNLKDGSVFAAQDTARVIQ